MLDNLTKEQKTVLLYWLIFGGVLVLLVLLIFGRRTINSIKYAQKADAYYHKVESYDRYYTVTSAIDKYYSMLNNKSNDDIVLLLNSDYKKKNNINSDNVLDKVKTYDQYVSFRGRLMCEKKLGKGYTSYYVSGELLDMFDPIYVDTAYLNVILNENNMTFSISIIDENEYGGNCNA